LREGTPPPSALNKERLTILELDDRVKPLALWANGFFPFISLGHRVSLHSDGKRKDPFDGKHDAADEA